jgi:hypothetical protein
MPEKNSIQTLSDSAQLVMDSLQHLDSVLLGDSIAHADSVARADSIALHAFKGFDGVVATGMPSDQNWVFLVLLFMFGVIVVSFLRAFSSPVEILTSFFNSKERNSIFNKTSIDNFEQKVYLFIFSITSLSLFSYLIFHEQGQAFSVLTYLYFLIATVGFFLAKYILSKLLSYIFLDKNTIKMVTDSYLNVVSFVALLFYPIMLIHLYATDISMGFTVNASLIITGLGLVLFAIKLVQIFLHKIVASLYLLLYLCTLEILPVIGMIQVFRYLAKHV